jgi:hypothetical protein
VSRIRRSGVLCKEATTGCVAAPSAVWRDCASGHRPLFLDLAIDEILSFAADGGEQTGMEGRKFSVDRCNLVCGYGGWVGVDSGEFMILA